MARSINLRLHLRSKISLCLMCYKQVAPTGAYNHFQYSWILLLRFYFIFYTQAFFMYGVHQFGYKSFG
jgi:hypothetical protein